MTTPARILVAGASIGLLTGFFGVGGGFVIVPALTLLLHLDMPALGLGWHDSFVAHDEITGQDWQWGAHNYVHLDPYHEPAHILSVRRPA